MQSDLLQRTDWQPTGEAALEAQGLSENELHLLPTTLAEVEKLTALQERMIPLPQAPIHTDHVLHAGMYSRTITMPPNCPLVGALIKIPTLVITVGDGFVYVNGHWKEVRGYQVVPGCKGRKQAFYSVGPLIITMIFATQARTVEEAEREFTDEHELLLSRRQDLNTVVITGE